ncbi:uncharacterized protein LOC111058115 isoform X2 [Nilaparvata lugens]|nr:uncharacterized protein LOC111058115 isoform X2 [Nilaparvata lugens]
MTAQKPAFAIEEETLHRTRAGRALRNRKYRRLVEDQRQNKRLFTPEIKRFLKSWLVRRRKNPYPNRSEKKDLALKTGLTYVQVCNWFANWRRKLKKSSRERQRNTWGNLIKDYNTKAQGNVEQFSISSDDSIWDETAVNTNDLSDEEQLTDPNPDSASNKDHCYFSAHNYCLQQGPTQKCPSFLQQHPTTCNQLDNNGNRVDRKCSPTSFYHNGGVGADDYNKRVNRKFIQTSFNNEGKMCMSEKGNSKFVETSFYNGREDYGLEKDNTKFVKTSFYDGRKDNASQKDNAKFVKTSFYKGEIDNVSEGGSRKFVETSFRDRNLSTKDNRKSTQPSFHNWGPDVSRTDNRKSTSSKTGRLDEFDKVKNKKEKTNPPLSLSKWLESAAKFVPRDSFIAWTTSGKCGGGGGGTSWQDSAKRTRVKDQRRRGKESSPGDVRSKELDAAEALTSLSRQTWITSAAP